MPSVVRLSMCIRLLRLSEAVLLKLGLGVFLCGIVMEALVVDAI